MISNTTVVIATSMALDFNNTKSRNADSQSLTPARKVHVKQSHAAGTDTLSRTNAAANQAVSESYEPPRPHPHPHAGARDADGNWGYAANVTRIRRWMLQRYREAAGANATHSVVIVVVIVITISSRSCK
jgi:hypothetical protein